MSNTGFKETKTVTYIIQFDIINYYNEGKYKYKVEAGSISGDQTLICHLSLSSHYVSKFYSRLFIFDTKKIKLIVFRVLRKVNTFSVVKDDFKPKIGITVFRFRLYLSASHHFVFVQKLFFQNYI